MSYSNRPSKRPDPTVAPVVRDLATGKVKRRDPFTPSTRLQVRNLERAARRATKRLP